MTKFHMTILIDLARVPHGPAPQATPGTILRLECDISRMLGIVGQNHSEPAVFAFSDPSDPIHISVATSPAETRTTVSPSLRVKSEIIGEES